MLQSNLAMPSIKIIPNHPKNSEVILYQTQDGTIKIDVSIINDNVWLPLDQIAQLFGRNKSTISRHLKNIFLEKELDQMTTVAKFATVVNDGKTYQVDYII